MYMLVFKSVAKYVRSSSNHATSKCYSTL